MKWLSALFPALLLLLLLSGLVQGPPPPEPVKPSLTGSMYLMPGLPPVSENESFGSDGLHQRRVDRQFSPTTGQLAPVLILFCDANGRPLCRRGYLKDAYFLFQQSAAAG